MNERIKKLLEKATVVTYHGPMLGDVADVDQEKFAELIVRECCDIDFRAKGVLSGEQSDEVSRVIAEHFGVE